MADADVVAIYLKLMELRQFVQGTDQAAKGVEKVGKEAETSGKRAQVGWKGLAKWAGGAAALYGAQRYIRGAVEGVESLAKSSIALSTTTGMDVQTSSAWVNVLKERNINARTFQRSMVQLSKTMESASTGNKKAKGTFDAMGISMDDVATGNTQAVLMQTADALNRMQNPAQRAAYAQQLLGRSGVQLLPLLSKGSAAIRDQIGLQERYGNVLDTKSTKGALQMVEKQREMNAAMEGAKLQLGVALLPVLSQFASLLVDIARFLQPVTKNALLFKGAVIVLTAAFVTYKLVMLAVTIAENLFNVSLGVTQVLITGGVILAIMALIAVIYLLIKHWGTVKQVALKVWHTILGAIQSVWTWIKANWPLLLAILVGPFGLAVLAIVRNIGRIKAAFHALVAGIKQLFNDLVKFIQGIPGRVTGAVRRIPGASRVLGAAGGVTGALGGIAGHFQHGGRARTGGGNYLVGEAGPEVVALPGGATVSPMGGTVVIPLYLDGKEIARAVARVTADRKARR